MDMDILRMMVMVAMLAVPATTDIRTRMVYTDALVMCGAVAMCFFAYDVIAGHFRGVLWYGLMGVGVVIGLVLPRMGIVGSADGHVIAVVSIMMPEHGGVPVAMLGIASGFIGSMVAMIIQNIVCNLQDAIKGSKYCGDIDFITMHMKRRGEKFTTDIVGPVRLSVRDEKITTDDGDDYFVPEGDSGMPVGCAVPAIAYIAAGVATLSIFAAF